MTDPTHGCPGRCGREVAYRHLACTECWRRLPAPLKDRQLRAWPRRRRDPAAYHEALAACLEWYRSNPPTGEVSGV